PSSEAGTNHHCRGSWFLDHHIEALKPAKADGPLLCSLVGRLAGASGNGCAFLVEPHPVMCSTSSLPRSLQLWDTLGYGAASSFRTDDTSAGARRCRTPSLRPCRSPPHVRCRFASRSQQR